MQLRSFHKAWNFVEERKSSGERDRDSPAASSTHLSFLFLASSSRLQIRSELLAQGSPEWGERNWADRKRQLVHQVLVAGEGLMAKQPSTLHLHTQRLPQNPIWSSPLILFFCFPGMHWESSIYSLDHYAALLGLSLLSSAHSGWELLGRGKHPKGVPRQHSIIDQ